MSFDHSTSSTIIPLAGMITAWLPSHFKIDNMPTFFFFTHTVCVQLRISVDDVRYGHFVTKANCAAEHSTRPHCANGGDERAGDFGRVGQVGSG